MPCCSDPFVAAFDYASQGLCDQRTLRYECSSRIFIWEAINDILDHQPRSSGDDRFLQADPFSCFAGGYEREYEFWNFPVNAKTIAWKMQSMLELSRLMFDVTHICLIWLPWYLLIFGQFRSALMLMVLNGNLVWANVEGLWGSDFLGCALWFPFCC